MLSLSIFTGCFHSGANPGEDSSHFQGETFTGTLKVQTGLYADLPGTHFLEMDDKKLPLSSLIVNLSDSKYLNKQVEVKGLVKESSNKEEFLEVETIKIVGDDVAEGSWEVYKSANLGFKIAYKNNWTLDETAKDQVVFVSPEGVSGDKVTVARKAAAKDADLPTTAIKFYGSKAQQATTSKIGKDNMEALKLTADKDKDITYVLKRYEWAYIITFDGVSESTIVENKNVFHEMLLDFQFQGLTESASTTESTTNNTDLSTAQNAVLGAVKSSASSWSSDLPADFQFLQAEFVGDNYVFINLRGSIEDKRYLLKYTYANNQFSGVEVVAKYKPGVTTDWELEEGSNPVAGQEKVVVNYKFTGELNVSTLKAGYRYFESSKYGFKMQYPAAWYYSSSAKESGYHFGFSDKPVAADNELVGLDITSSTDNPENPEINNVGDAIEVKIKGYVLKFSSQDNSQIMKEIATSVQNL